MNHFFSLLLLAAALVLTSCVSAPSVSYAESQVCRAERAELKARLINLLPREQRTPPDAQEEAEWLADAAHKGSAAVARVNDPMLPSWLNNRLVNSSRSIRERGLCWHYQHDVYRELRRRPLHYFRIGCCVLDQHNGSEHHCLYIAPRGTRSWRQGVVFCAWWRSGKVKIWPMSTLVRRDCVEEPEAAAFLARVYPEGHSYPMEHWAKVRSDSGDMRDYLYSAKPDGAASRQGQLMYRNMREGLQRRGGKLTDY